MSLDESRITELHMEIKIDASPSAVWASLTENIDQWWPAEFYAGGETGSRTFSLEPEPGGRMMERWEHGGGVLWGTVISIEPDVKLQVIGATFPPWGGPSQWFGTWELVSLDGKTLLKFNEHAVGLVSDSGTQEKDKGWQFLWKTLKAHVEGVSPPVWVD